MHTWTVKNWMQYSASHVATVLRLCFCPKMASEAISEHLISKNFLGEHAPRPPYSLACMHTHTHHADTHVTPLQKILATGLLRQYMFAKLNKHTHSHTQTNFGAYLISGTGRFPKMRVPNFRDDGHGNSNLPKIGLEDRTS